VANRYMVADDNLVNDTNLVEVKFVCYSFDTQCGLLEALPKFPQSVEVCLKGSLL